MMRLFHLAFTFILVLSFIFGLAPSCATSINTSAALASTQPGITQSTGALPAPEILSMIGQANKDRVLTDLQRLTGETQICTPGGCVTIANRKTGSTGLQWAKDYISKELAGFGYSVEINPWSSSGYSDQNIIARKQGVAQPDEEIFIVAHMDGVGDGANSRYPAADDNGSGMVDALELARVLAGYWFARTVVFFFSTGEEQETLGAASYLNHLSTQEINAIKYVVNVDTIGYDANQDGAMELWNGDDPASLALAQTMADTIATYKLKLTPAFISGCG